MRLLVMDELTFQPLKDYLSKIPAIDGPKDFLSWVIESMTIDFTPKKCAERLEGRLPTPVEDLASWVLSDEEHS